MNYNFFIIITYSNYNYGTEFTILLPDVNNDLIELVTKIYIGNNKPENASLSYLLILHLKAYAADCFDTVSAYLFFRRFTEGQLYSKTGCSSCGISFPICA